MSRCTIVEQKRCIRRSRSNHGGTWIVGFDKAEFVQRYAVMMICFGVHITYSVCNHRHRI